MLERPARNLGQGPSTRHYAIVTSKQDLEVAMHAVMLPRPSRCAARLTQSVDECTGRETVDDARPSIVDSFEQMMLNHVKPQRECG
jgi:hypothetical protein